MAFQNPLALLLLLLLVPVIRIGWPSRGYDRKREITALALRVIIILLLVLAAAGLELRRASDALAVVFLVDTSDSMPEDGRETAQQFIRDALEAMRPQDQAAVILFGADALVERAMSSDRQLSAFSSVPIRAQTDIAEAVRLAMALYPPDAARRMVLLTDGRQTTGDAAAAARLSVDAGVDFIIVPISDPRSRQEVTLLDVDVPQVLFEGEAFDLNLTVHATSDNTMMMRVFSGGSLAFEGSAALNEGTQDFRIPLTAGETGFSPFTVQIGAAEDAFFQNNRMTTYTRVVGPPKVLVIAPEPGEPLPFSEEVRPDEAAALQAALDAAGFTVDVLRPSALPFELALLGEYAGVVLVDVPARQLSNRQMLALQSYVRDLGGGLITIGGPTAYGVGGYFRTPLEDILPIDMEIKDQERRPSLAMVFIIDRSGSMADTSSGSSKLELAKEAAARSVELLFPGDKVGVIAFDDTASWVVPITDLSDPQAVTGAIESIGIGGGTDILAGLRAMAATLPEDDARVKHVILLTDGGASPAGIPELVENLYAVHGITLTSVGVGSDAAPFLEDIARIGGGRYHFTDRPESIPNIFTEETTLATRSYIVEEHFFPMLVSRSSILGQISSVPPLFGYVAATAKNSAQTILISEQEDPILAAWQYGLGKAVAWTSDATARWSRDWIAWEGFQPFWAQAVRFTISDRQTSPLQVHVEAIDGQTLIRVDAISESGEYLNRFDFAANIVFPDGTVYNHALEQTEPGRYEGDFDTVREGAYLLRINGTDPESGESVSELAGWVRTYSPEYRYLNDDPDFLPRLAGFAGGSLMSAPEPAKVFSVPESQASAGRPLWPALVIAALFLLPLDVGVRRLALERRDITRAWMRVRSRWPFNRTPAAISSPQSERLSTLLRAKERLDSPRREEKPEVRKSDVPVQPTTSPEQKKAGQARPERSEVVQDSPLKDGQSTTAALLARKRAREEAQRKKNE